jgi:peptidyl-prolyl cis-trans isomerase B (cyclophilin B)
LTRNRLIYSVSLLLALVVVSGCAIDRSELATPESLRDLPPPPEVVASNYCDDVPPDTGKTSATIAPLEFEAAEQVIDAEANNYFACFVTSKGMVEVTLFDDNAPETVNNLVFLANEGFYDGVLWHRVVDGFVIQGGDRNGPIEGRAGTGGPGYQWNDEPSALLLPHAGVGRLSMANAGPNTNGSQFFVTLEDGCCNHLDGLHAIFGEVSGEGDMDVVGSIEQGDLIQAIRIVEVDAESGDVLSIAEPPEIEEPEVDEEATAQAVADAETAATAQAEAAATQTALPFAEETMEFEQVTFVIEPETTDYRARFVTNRGTFEVDLFDDEAPDTVNNFVFLAQEGFYNGTAWHRVVPNFVIQGGDRNGLIAERPGTGGPGYTWDDEAAALELSHTLGVGVLSMANAGPNTNGSQFFVTLAEGCCDHLDGLHAVFGQVIDEDQMEVVLNVRQGDILETVEIIEVEAGEDDASTSDEAEATEEATEEPEAAAGDITEVLGELDASDED